MANMVMMVVMVGMVPGLGISGDRYGKGDISG